MRHRRVLEFSDTPSTPRITVYIKKNQKDTMIHMTDVITVMVMGILIMHYSVISTTYINDIIVLLLFYSMYSSNPE